MDIPQISTRGNDARLPVRQPPDADTIGSVPEDATLRQAFAVRKARRRALLWEKTIEFTIYTFVVAVAIFVLGGVAAILGVAAEQYTWRQFSSLLIVKGGILYLASWVVLLAISVLASFQVREVLKDSEANRYRLRANYIAILIGLVLVVMVFKQPFLDRLFANQTAGGVLKTVLFGGALAGGWVVWYLKHLAKYGEFFHVLLFTIVIGFCWYARLTAPEEVQLTAVAFLLGSLLRLAKDYLDAAANPSQTPAA
jgi:hypothetical protein